MVKILVRAEEGHRKDAVRLCRRLGKVKKAKAEFLLLKLKGLPAKKVLNFLASQPVIVSAYYIE